MTNRRAAATTSLLLLCTTGVAACGSDGGSAAPQASEVPTALHEWSITPKTATTTSGSVTFDLTNTGTETHEMLIVRTDLAANALPVDAAGEVDERGEGLTFVDEREGISPGKTVELTTTLQPGRYVLLCNLPGHYRQGMATAFEVTGDTVSTSADAPTYSIVPASTVIAGLDATVALLDGYVRDGWTDADRATAVLYDGWYGYEGTIRATDMNAYLDLEDQLASARRSINAKDQAGLAAAAKEFASLLQRYEAAHPG